MWKLLFLLTVLVNIFSIVSSAKKTETTIITTNTAAAAAASSAVVENGDKSSAARAAAASAASSTTIIKTEQRVKKCAVNERYSKCPEKLCQPQVCEDVGVPQCSIHDERYFNKSGPCPGPPACICVEGFVRNDEGVCMPATECPSCGNDKNATAGCGVNCGRRCSNYMLSDVACGNICYPNSCDCRKDYVFDDYLGVCVLPQDCSNKNATEPEGTEGTDGTPGNEDGNDGTDPCDDCSENNCDNTNETTEDIGETDCNGMDGESTESGMDSSSTTESNEDTDSTTEDSEVTTEGSENGSTTAEETEIATENGSTTVETATDMTTEESENGLTTEAMDKGMTTEDPGNEETTEQSPSSQGTTKAPTSTTTRRSRRPRTTTRRPRTTTRRSRRTTTKSPSRRTTTTTEASTTKGPKDCRGRNEWYFDCAPACPQRTCEDYLNGIRCQSSDRTTGCKPECRCMSGFYKDAEGNCVSSRQCRESGSTGMSTTTTSTTEETTCEEEAIPLFAVGSLGYTLKILYETSLANAGKSVMVGGASILYLMGELALFAKGRAKRELLNVFNLKETEQISCAFPKISAALTTEYPGIEFSLFCKIYADDDCAMTDEFIQNTENIFVMAPRNLDFSASDAAKIISDEVDVMTNGNFENYVKPITISTLDNLIMVDAEGFQGKWEKQFNPADTTLKDFYWSGRISKVQSMYQKETFLYGESSVLGAKMLKMNYVGGMFGLVIFLPNSRSGLSDLLKKLQNTNVVYSAVGSLTMQMVEIDLPKFEISVANRLKIPSKKAGVTQIFSNSSLGLENVASCEMPYVSEVLQKITFHVDEYGMGETRDVDFAPIVTTQAPRRQQINRFKADHPFVYSLFHKEVMLQAGIFAGN